MKKLDYRSPLRRTVPRRYMGDAYSDAPAPAGLTREPMPKEWLEDARRKRLEALRELVTR